MLLGRTALIRLTVCSMVILGIQGTIYFLPTHSYPEQAQQTNTPDKRQQLEQLKKVGTHDGKDSEFQKLGRSISSSCEIMLKLVKSKLTSSLAKEHPSGKETWQRLATDYLYYNLDEVMRCIKLLFADEHFVYQ